MAKRTLLAVGLAAGLAAWLSEDAATPAFGAAVSLQLRLHQGGTLDPATTAYLSAGTSAGAPPSSIADKVAINDKIVLPLRRTGLMGILDAFYLPAVNDLNLGLVNLVNPGTFNATASSSPAFLAERGMIGSNGTSQGYWDTGFNPVTASGHFAQNDACMGIESLSNEVNSTFDAGNAHSNLRIHGASTMTASATANASSTDNPNVTNSWGDLWYSRAGSGSYTVYQRGAPLASPSTASAALTSATFYIGRTNGQSSSSRKRIAAFWFGAHCTAAQVQDFALSLTAYMASKGVTFPWTGDQMFVANAAAPGLPVGDDTIGDGTQGSAYNSLNFALTVANPGQEIVLNGTHQPATIFPISQSQTISAYSAATLQAKSGQSRVATVSGSGTALSLRGVTLDGNGGGSLLAFADTDSVMTASLDHVTAQNFTSKAFTNASSGATARATAATASGATLTFSVPSVDGSSVFNTDHPTTIQGGTTVSSHTSTTLTLSKPIVSSLGVSGVSAGDRIVMGTVTMLATANAGAGSSAINFTLPSAIVNGALVTDSTTPASIIAGTTVAAHDSTTVTLSGSVAGTVAAGDTIVISPSLKLNVAEDRTICAARAVSCWYLHNWSAGSFTGSNASVNLTVPTTGNAAYVDLQANEVAPTVSIANPSVIVAAAESAIHSTEAIAVVNVPDVSIVSPVVSISSVIGTCRGIHIDADLTAPLDSSDAVIDHPYVYNDCGGGGGGILIGEDGPLASQDQVNAATIAYPTIIGTPRSQLGQLHAIELGYQTGGTVYGGTFITNRYAIVSKGMKSPSTTVYYGNTAIDSATNAYYTKGGEGSTWINNVMWNTGDPAFRVGFAVQDDGLLTCSSGTVIVNNIVMFAGPGGQFVLVDPCYGVASFATNDYYASGGGGSWSYQGMTYSTLGAWQGAREASALGVDPLMAGAPSDLSLLSASVLAAAGTHRADAPTDHAGFSFANPPSVGAYQYH